MTTHLISFLGLVLIFLEFFLPGGILAVIGTVLLLISTLLFGMHVSIPGAVLYFLLLAALTYVTCQLALWRLKKSKSKDEYYLGNDQEGYVAVQFDKAMIGQVATVLTELKPAGHIAIAGKQFQALSETGFVSKGDSVLVVGGKGSHLIVREKKQ